MRTVAHKSEVTKEIPKHLAAEPDLAEIRRGIALQWRPGDVRELRTLGKNRNGFDETRSGYFSDPDKAADSAYKESDAGRNVYLTAAPVKSELLARRINRVGRAGKDSATSDDDVDRRTALVVDFDPARPKGIPATDAQQHAAIERAEQAAAAMSADFGWPEPVKQGSGNGCYLRYEIDEPNDAATAALVAGVYACLDRLFSDPAVTVDKGVYNASRIFRVAGTVNRKGDPTPEMPHRLSRILSLPATRELLTRDKLESVVLGSDVAPVADDQCDDVAKWLADHDVAVKRDSPYTNANGATHRWLLETCPLCNESDNAAVVLKFLDGRRGFKCHHNRCVGKGWKDFRDAVAPGEKSPPKLTDAGNAERFAAEHGANVRFCHAWNKWLFWNGRRWQLDDRGEVVQRAKETAKKIYAEAVFAGDKEDRKAIAKWAHSSQDAKRLISMLSLARSEHPIPVSPDQLDTNAWLLNCENGTVDLTTGELRPHDPADLLTKTTGINYPTDANAPPIWRQCLDTVFAGDAELIAFVQRLLGSALAGEVRDHILPVFHGNGANGKGTLCETVMQAFGDYALKAPAGFLTLKRGDSHPTRLADLHGRRLVLISETGDGSKLDEPLVKELTGGDTIRARRLHENYWQFKPTHTLVLVTNYRPTVHGTDHGIWRRLRLVPFDVTIARENQDTTLANKLRGELPQILRWLVTGCLEWQKAGLQEPAKVLLATETYRNDSDTFARWFAECCVLNAAGKCRADAVYQSYTVWTHGESEIPLTKNKFADRLKGQGYQKTRRNDGIYYAGFDLAEFTSDAAGVEGVDGVAPSSLFS